MNEGYRKLDTTSIVWKCSNGHVYIDREGIGECKICGSTDVKMVSNYD